MSRCGEICLDVTTYGHVWQVWPDIARYGEICLDVTTYSQIWPHMVGMARYHGICCAVALGMPDLDILSALSVAYLGLSGSQLHKW